jgi:hypothetical protein
VFLTVASVVLLAALGPTGIDKASARPQRPAERNRDARTMDRASARELRAARGEEVLRTIEAVRIRRLLNELRVNEEQKRIVRETYRRGVESKESLLRERAELLGKMRGLVLAGDAVDIHDRELALGQLTHRFLQMEREIAEIRWLVDEKILEHLGPLQRVRYLLFNERFERELRERIGALKRTRRAPGRAAPPADMPE